jgi:RNA-directed DNA polymerase
VEKAKAVGNATDRDCNIIPRESEQTSTWCLITRTFVKSVKEAKQMMAKPIAGAASHQDVNWHAINWQQAHENVRRLQARIVKATQQGKWGKVKALQHLLTRSFSGKALAVKRVTQNTGKRTAGVDGELWDSPEKKAAGLLSLRQRGYKPLPLRRIYIPKSHDKTKLRPLSIPTMHDRAMQALYLLALEPIAETTADPNSYGFRKERSTADAIGQCYKIFNGPHRAEYILEADIKSCFDQISHEWLETHIPMEKPILRKWLKAGFMDKRLLYPTTAGTPQGGVVSPTLANLVLDGLERELKEHFPKTKRGNGPKVNLCRYADDFVISGKSKELLENEVKPIVEQFLKERGLALSPEKTHITHITEGFDFLGQNVRRYKEGLRVKPSKQNVKRFLAKVRQIIKSNKQAPTGLLIAQLNPVIRGWAQHHQHVSSGQTFSKVDRAIFQTLWRWAKRRHPNKGNKWVRDKYFKAIGNRHWVFQGEHDNKIWTLIKTTDTPYKLYNKIKGEANPFDPQWELYFEHRLHVKMADNLKGRRQLLRLWKEQKGTCPVCQEKITKITGWNNHHLLDHTLGGPDTDENRVLLHPNCHQQVHNQPIPVAKPCPVK